MHKISDLSLLSQHSIAYLDGTPVPGPCKVFSKCSAAIVLSIEQNGNEYYYMRVITGEGIYNVCSLRLNRI